MSDETISSFADITGATADEARSFLEMAQGDLEGALQLYFENPDLLSSITSAPSRGQSSSTARNQPSVGHEDEHGVIHIDSDEEDRETDMELDGSGDAAVARSFARSAQEEEDAAMAQRLQQELFSESSGGLEGVRSPIRSTTETLVAPTDPFGIDEDYRQAELNAFFARRRAEGARRPGNPFSQSIWENPPQETDPDGAENSNSGTRSQRLAELFRPPYDLISRFSLDDAREEGKDQKKWLLVNLQDTSDFSCQALNRDIWKDAAVREIVKENFIFLQYDKDDPLGRQYISFYLTHGREDNPDNYPHVSIIDPRTGEQVKAWSGRPFPTALQFHSDLAEFLDRYSLTGNRKNPVAKVAARRAEPLDVSRLTEEEMLEMALKNSLAGAPGASEASGRSDFVDPDSLTKTPLHQTGGDEGDDEDGNADGGSGDSVFSQISSTNPHTEPENGPGITRIQFRHATGRVIRRFNLQDPVRRIYEWLKASPLDGQEGAGFELKRMPQGQDLIGSLDESIEDAGLKQGTVMVEFVED